MKELTIIQKTKGLHAQIENSQVLHAENGLEFLDVAINVDITDGGKILRRRGFTDTIQANPAHSFYSYSGSGYCVMGTDLFLVSQSLVSYGVRHGFSNSKVRYQGVGGKVYYSNGILNGKVEGRISYPWEPDEYAGPRAAIHAGEVTAPPVCKHLALYKGHLFLSEGSTLWHTPPMWYDGVNRATGFVQFDSDIIMLLALDNTLVVGTENEVMLLSGDSPADFTFQSLIKGRVIEDTGITKIGLKLKESIAPGKTAIFTMQDGIYAVGKGGDLFDITGNRLLLPNVVSGSAYITDNFYTVLVDE